MLYDSKNSVFKKKITKLPKVLGVVLASGVCVLCVYGALSLFNSSNINKENEFIQNNNASQLSDRESFHATNSESDAMNAEKSENMISNSLNSTNNFFESSDINFNKINNFVNDEENENNARVENFYNDNQSALAWGNRDLQITGNQIFEEDWDETFVDGVRTYYLHPTCSGKCFEIKNYDIQTKSNSKIFVESTSKDFDVTVKLCGVNIESDSPFKIYDNNPGNVNVVLADGSDNKLVCTSENNAALQKNSTNESVGKLTISGEKDGSGKLSVEGKRDGAGIGSAKYSDLCNVELKGGIITAISGHNGASIGSGFGGEVHNLIISDGSVTVEKNFEDLKDGETPDGAGIGSGAYTAEAQRRNNVYGLKITNGTVTAKGYYGAAIGSGRGGALYSLEINGGEIDASLAWNDHYNKPYAAAIGTGEHGSISYKSDYDCGLKIFAGNIKASGYSGAAIGTGVEGNISDHTGIIIYDGNVEATQLEINNSKGQSSGIGAGIQGDLDEDGFIAFYGGTISASSNSFHVGCIGTNEDSSCEGTIYVNGGSIITNNFDHSASDPIKFSKDPVDDAGNLVYPIDIDNPDDLEVYINNTKYNGINHKGIDSSDTKLHGYLSSASGNEVTVTLKSNDGTKDKKYVYHLQDGKWKTNNQLLTKGQNFKNTNNLQSNQGLKLDNKNSSQKQIIDTKNIFSKRENHVANTYIKKYRIK